MNYLITHCFRYGIFIYSLKQGRTYTFDYPEGGMGGSHTLGPMGGSMGSIGSSNSGGIFHAHEGSMSSSQSVSSSNSKHSEDPDDEPVDSMAPPTGDR